MKYVVSVILFSFLILPQIEGQEVSVSARLDTTRILIGDQITYTLTVEKPDGIEVHIPQLTDTLAKNVEIISGPVSDTTLLDNERICITDKYLITSFYPGQYQIKPVYVEVKSENTVKRYFSDYTWLEVLRVNIAPADTTARIFDIVGPRKAPVTAGELLPWVLMGVAGAILIYFLVRLLSRLKVSKSAPEATVNIEPAHIIAFRELENLKEEKLWQKGEVKKYYTLLTEIIRRYLENRFGIWSMELTTDETLRALTVKGFPKNGAYKKLETVLTGADLVKFAKYKPLTDENESSWEDSWNFVSETMLKDEADAENEAEPEEKGKEVKK